MKWERFVGLRLTKEGEAGEGMGDLRGMAFGRSASEGNNFGGRVKNEKGRARQGGAQAREKSEGGMHRGRSRPSRPSRPRDMFRCTHCMAWVR